LKDRGKSDDEHREIDAFRDASNAVGTFPDAFHAIPRASFLLSIAIGMAHFAIEANACGLKGEETQKTTRSGRDIRVPPAVAARSAAAQGAPFASIFFSIKNPPRRKLCLSLPLNFQGTIHSPDPARDSSANSARETRMIAVWREAGKPSRLFTFAFFSSFFRFFFSPARLERE